MKTCNEPTRKEIGEVIRHLIIGGWYDNGVYQFNLLRNGQMMRYDLDKGTYKFYYDINTFAKAIVRFLKRGF